MCCDAYLFNFKSSDYERKVTLALLHILIHFNKYGIKIANYLGIDDISKCCKQSEIRSRETNTCRFLHILFVYLKNGTIAGSTIFFDG